VSIFITYTHDFIQVKAAAPTAMNPEDRTAAVLCQMPNLEGLKAKNSVVNANQETPMIIVCPTLFEVYMLTYHLLLLS
jgi:hypothetical protein